MSKKLAIWVEPPYQRDELFNPASPMNRDNCLSSFRFLRAALSGLGWDCHTQDIYLASGKIPDTVLFQGVPRAPLSSVLQKWRGRTKNIVMLFECEVISPENWGKAGQAQFDVILTWDKRLVDNKRYFEMRLPNPFPADTEPSLEDKTAFCVMIAGNKKHAHPRELYSEREKAIRWFETNHPGEFDLYGMGWDRFFFDGPRIVRTLNRIKPLTRLLAPTFPSYRGTVAEKRKVMRAYKYSICYENTRDFPGYISEKIFDCLFAGCLPVYLGAPDIADYIPRDCFIDKRDFGTYEELYAYLKRMPDTEYSARLAAIPAFLRSPGALSFSDSFFAENAAKIINDHK